jgi:TP901 family phage tail tape measure protein
MAINTQKFVFEYATDSAGATKAINIARQLEKAYEQLGLKIDQNAKVLDFVGSAYEKNGKVFYGLKAILENTDKSIQSVSVNAKKAGSGLSILANSAKVADTSARSLGGALGGLGINLGQLLTKGLQGIVIYRVLGLAFTTLTNSLATAGKFLIDFESQLAQVQIVSNESKEDINKLGAASLELASRFGTSFGDLGEALTTFAQLGLKSNEILSALGPTLAFSAVSGRKVGAVVEDLVAIQKSFNLTFDDTSRIYDSITKAQLDYSITTAQLAAGLRKLGPIAGALGLTLEETSGFIIAVQEQTRQSGEETANAIESLFGRLQSLDQVGKLQGIVQIPLFMNTAGKATDDFTGRVRPTTEILAILAERFKTASDAEKASIAVTLGGRSRYSEAAALLNNYDKALEATAAQLLSLGATQNAVNTLAGTGAFKFRQLGTEILEILNIVRPFVNTFVTGLGEGLRLMVSNLGTQIKIVSELAQTIPALGGKLPDFKSIFPKTENKETAEVKAITAAYENLINIRKRNQAAIDSASGAKKEELKQQADKFEAELIKSLNKFSSRNKLGLNLNSSEDLATQLRKFVDTNDSEGSLKANVNEQVQQDEKTALETAIQLKRVQIDGVALGKSRIAIAREELAILNQKKVKDTTNKDDRDRLELEIAIYEQSLKQLDIDSRKNKQLLLAQSYGYTELEIQKLKITQAEEILRRTGDETALRKEQLNLEELILKKRAESSNLLQGSLTSSISNLLQGKGTGQDIASGFRDTIIKGFADEAAKNLTSSIFKTTGIGEQYAQLTEAIGKAFTFGSDTAYKQIVKGFEDGTATFLNPVTGKTQRNPFAIPPGFGTNSPLATAIPILSGTKLTGTSLKGLASLIEETVSRGATSTATSKSGGLLGGLFGGIKGIFDKLGGALSGDKASGSGGIFSGLASGLSKLFGGGGADTAGGTGGGLFGGLGKLLGGSGGAGKLFGSLGAGFGAFQSARNRDFLGATAQGALAGAQFGGYGAVIGGVAGFVMSLFGKKKKTPTEIQEETKQFQVASRIDVTNKKLDIVNRNLVALKQTFETIILPDSAFLGTKRSLEDQFSVNSRRGIF